MLTHEIRYRQIENLVFGLVDHPAMLCKGFEILPQQPHRRANAPGNFGNDRHHFRHLPGDDRRHAGFQYSGLLIRNFGQ